METYQPNQLYRAASPIQSSPAAPEISVKMDIAGIQARRIVQRWMARETA